LWMTEPFVETEVQRTKSKWVAQVFKGFGRPRTTMRALFYHALRRKESDYPICGYFVGEIRVTRPYHESDGERLLKWATKARELGYVPNDAFLEEVPGEHLFLGDAASQARTFRIELWLNRSAFDPLLLPVCRNLGVTLVSVSGGPPSRQLIEEFWARAEGRPTVVLCFSDLRADSFTFCRDLARAIAVPKLREDLDIRLQHIALTPEQVVEMNIPMVPGVAAQKIQQSHFQRYLKPYRLNSRKVAELDALEAYYPGGLAGFVRDNLSRYASGLGLEEEHWVLDLKKGIIPGEDE
jgi:hypothetical protein